MSCFCWRRSGSKDDHVFHWPNFTFAHSQHSINPRRVHSTFSLHHKPKPRRVLRRRHTLHNGTIVANLKSHKPPRPKSIKSSMTAPAAVDVPFTEPEHHMTDELVPPRALVTSDVRPQHISWAGQPAMKMRE